MAIIVTTSRPRALLSRIREGMSDGAVTTWICDSDGDFTMSSDTWKDKAWLRPTVREDSLALNIFPPRDTTMPTSVYAVYHARFIEILLRYFDKAFQSARATAMPVSPDRVSSK
jgi:hypothetical protein